MSASVLNSGTVGVGDTDVTEESDMTETVLSARHSYKYLAFSRIKSYIAGV